MATRPRRCSPLRYDDYPVFSLSGGSLKLNQGGSAPFALDLAEGGSATFNVHMDYQPATAHDTAVNITSNDPGVATVDPATLIFTSSNWNTPQVVTVTGVDDGVANPGGGRVTQILGNSTSGFAFHHRPTGFDMVTVTVTDADNTDATGGICDRTQQVRDAIMAKIEGVDDCADVTEAHLAEVRGTLDLREQDIVSLQSNDFGGLSSLISLFLDENDLTALPVGVFAGLSSLEQLWMKDNRLATLPDGAFAGLSSLTDLLLSDNQLTVLPDGVFAGLPSLRQLHLHRNQLTALPDGAFAGLSSLLSLTLSGNELTELPAGVFTGLSSLTSLWLFGNHLTALPRVRSTDCRRLPNSSWTATS